MSNETSNEDQKVLTQRRLRVSIVVIARVITRVVIAAAIVIARVVIAGVIARVVIAGVITRVVITGVITRVVITGILIAVVVIASITVASILFCIRRDGISRRCLNGGTGWQSDRGRLDFTPVLPWHVMRTSSDLVQSREQESE